MAVRRRWSTRDLNRRNVLEVPEAWGVYLLMSDDLKVSFVGSTSSLRKRLRQHLLFKDIPDAKYFKCYQMEGESDSRDLEERLSFQYFPEMDTLKRKEPEY